MAQGATPVPLLEPEPEGAIFPLAWRVRGEPRFCRDELGAGLINYFHRYPACFRHLADTSPRCAVRTTFYPFQFPSDVTWC